MSANAAHWCLQTSLSQFNQLYELAIERSEKAALPSKRISNIIEYMTYEIYLYIQRGLFERHKIIFALMLANKVCRCKGACCTGKMQAAAVWQHQGSRWFWLSRLEFAAMEALLTNVRRRLCSTRLTTRGILQD